MKIILLNILMILAVQVSNCGKNKNAKSMKVYTEFGTCYSELETTGVIEKNKGKIIKINNELWAIVPEGKENQRYGICQIPEELKVENLNIIFSGDVKKIAANVRYAASPFVVKEIVVE